MKPKFFFIITIFVAAALAGWGYRNHERALAERCYDYVDPLRVKVGQTEFRVPQKDIAYISEEYRYESARSLFDLDAQLDEVKNRSFLNGQQRFAETKPVFIYDKDNPGVVRKGICRAARDLPILADRFSVFARIHISRSDRERPGLPTYCSEATHLAEYKPCAYAPGFYCREIKAEHRAHYDTFAYSPDSKILGLPAVLACKKPYQESSPFVYCVLWAWAGKTASIQEYTGWDFKLAVRAVPDGRYLQEVKDKISEIDKKLRSIVVPDNNLKDLMCNPEQTFCQDYRAIAPACYLRRPGDAFVSTVLWRE